MKSYNQFCALALALDHIGERWKLLIVRELMTGDKRFSDLLNGLPGIATNLLSQRLQAMEQDGLIVRRQVPPPTPALVYSLTDAGGELEETVHALIRWGGRFMPEAPAGLTFHADWLAVALKALTNGRHASSDFIAQISVSGGAVYMRGEKHGAVEVSVASEGDPDCSIEGDAPLILGLASGTIDWNAAVKSGLTVTGSRTAVAAVRSIFRRE